MLKDIYYIYIYSFQQLLTWRSFSCQKKNYSRFCWWLFMTSSSIDSISLHIKWFRKDIRYIFSSFSKTVQIFILFNCSNNIVNIYYIILIYVNNRILYNRIHPHSFFFYSLWYIFFVYIALHDEEPYCYRSSPFIYFIHLYILFKRRFLIFLVKI